MALSGSLYYRRFRSVGLGGNRLWMQPGQVLLFVLAGRFLRHGKTSTTTIATLGQLHRSEPHWFWAHCGDADDRARFAGAFT